MAIIGNEAIEHSILTTDGNALPSVVLLRVRVILNPCKMTDLG